MARDIRELEAVLGFGQVEPDSKTTITLEGPVMAKKLLNFKTTESLIMIGETELTYGAHIQGVVGEGDKSITSILSTPKESDNGDVFNTYIFFDPHTGDVKEVTDHAWLQGTVKNFNADGYPESLRGNIIKSLSSVKGIFKDSPQVSLSEATVEAVTSDARFTAVVDSIKETYALMLAEIQKEKLSYSSVGINEFIKRYAFRKHVMLLGPRGLGKTFTVSKYLQENSIPTEFIAGHTGLESIDLLGYYIKAPDGSLIWMDGPLTAAFRTAEKGQSAFFIDEVLRIPARELNILIGALTPDSSGHYQLRTNRIVETNDGIGKSETIRVPVANLWAIATTNIGSDYDTEDMDLALSDRFRMYEMSHSTDAIRGIIESCNNHFTSTIIDQLMSLYTAVESLVHAKELTNTINVRYLCETLSMCTDPKELRSYLFDLTPNICSRTTDGVINEVEEQIFKDTVKKIVK